MGIGLSCKTENLAEKIQFQQQAVAELKREIFGKDKKARSKYIREFVAEFNDFQSVSSYEELLEVARHVRVIYVGDYHALAQSQQFQAQLLSDLSDEKLEPQHELLV